MGNRATIVFTDNKGEYSPAVYLHWNGGPESVYGFLEELNRRHIRGDEDLMYQTARFIQIVGEFFDQDTIGGLSLGVTAGPASDRLEDLAKIQTDLGDNGIYLVFRSGDNIQVRRFKESVRFVNDMKPIISIIEVSPELVSLERQDAYTHKYNLLKDEFLKITGSKTIRA